MELVVQRNGGIRCVYNEAIDLSILGRVQIKRGSHVEPDDDGRWFADLTPVCGPQLGPFFQRSEALAAEREWLTMNWLLADVSGLTICR